MDENRKWLDAEEPAEEETGAERAGERPADGGSGDEARLMAMLEAFRADVAEETRRAVDEALRRSAMSPEERAAWEAQDREQSLAQREQALTRREARADALELLAQKGLPAALADAVRCDSPADARQSVEALEAAFREAVQAAVEERLKGKSPAAGASAQDAGDELDDESYYRLQGLGGKRL